MEKNIIDNKLSIEHNISKSVVSKTKFKFVQRISIVWKRVKFLRQNHGPQIYLLTIVYVDSANIAS